MRNFPPASSDARNHEKLPFAEAFSSAEVRARLVRFCERRTGDGATAEDIAQETLLVGWRQAQEGRAPRDCQPYLFGIARRLCLSWHARAGRRELPLESAAGSLTLSLPAPDADPLASLLHAERAELIDRALSQVDSGVRALLVAYYLEEQPLGEIAGRLNLTENATAVRLHRSRDALARTLRGGLRADAAAHGLLTSDAASGWGATRLWCPRCGKHRLLGRFDSSEDGYRYALRCPDCDQGGDPPLGFTSDALPLRSADVLTGVQGYRAAFKRLHRWWDAYITQGLATRRAACVYCGRSVLVLTAQTDPDGTRRPGFFTHCAGCGGTFWVALGGLLFHAARLRDFWQAHPRIRYAVERPVECEGRRATLVGFADQQSGARLEVIFAQDDLRPLRVLQTK